MGRHIRGSDHIIIKDPLDGKQYELDASITNNDGHITVEHKSMWEMENGKQKSLVLSRREAAAIFVRCNQQLTFYAGEQERVRNENVARNGKQTRIRDLSCGRLHTNRRTGGY